VRLSELAERLGGRLEGEDAEVHDLSAPDCPREGTVAVIDGAKALSSCDVSKLAALIAPQGLELEHDRVIRVAEPRLALARATALFNRRPRPEAGISPGAVVHPSARLGENVSIGPFAVIEAGAAIGEGVTIGAGCYVGAGVTVGEGTRLHPNVSLYDGASLGKRVTIHSGAVVGADGFGYAPSPMGAVKIEHLGGVEIADEVEIGAGSCVDRGTLCPTRIGARTKIDNLVQVGHNVQIGSDCLIAGQTGIGGSTVIEDGVIIGGAVGITDHVRIGKGSQLAGRSGVSKNVPPGKTWAGFPAQPHRKWVRQLYLLGKLEAIWDMLKGEWRQKS
jgi:UDP-3-O-[3-hydroxymyristoyl] glucosamine N-acyltransferase